MTKNIEISAIVPVSDRLDNTGSLASEYLESLKATDKSFELVYVLDGRHEKLCEELVKLAVNEKRLKIVQLARSFGESAALTAGFEQTAGEIVLTLPAYYQIQADEILKLIAELDSCDVAIGARWRRARSFKFEVVRRKLFHWLVSHVTGDTFNDLGCGARALRRSVVDEVPIYGDQHRFLPLLAIRRGFRVREVQVLQSDKDRYEVRYGPRVYVQRLLDILTVFFLVRFTKKPLRFFGMIGSVTFAVGAIFLLRILEYPPDHSANHHPL